MKKSIVLFTALCLLAVMTAQAQSAIVPAGGTASGNGGTVTYTAGQIAVQTNSDGTTSISEGVQQPFEISVVGVDERPDITLTANLYPNPTLSTCNLQCDSWMGLDEVSQRRWMNSWGSSITSSSTRRGRSRSTAKWRVSSASRLGLG